MPLPPNNSRAHATVSRHFDVVKALASAACASLNFPSACNCAWRTIRHCEAVMFASIFARRSCISWNEPIGLPNFRGVAERVAALKTIFFRHAAIFQGDVAVLHDLERDLVLDLFHAKPRCGLVFNDETFDLIVVDVARPDDRDIAPRRIADPALLAVKNPR